MRTIRGQATQKPNSQGADRCRGEGTTKVGWMCEIGTEDCREWGKTGGGRSSEVVGGRNSEFR